MITTGTVWQVAIDPVTRKLTIYAVTNGSSAGALTNITFTAGNTDEVVITGPNAAITWNTNAAGGGGGAGIDTNTSYTYAAGTTQSFDGVIMSDPGGVRQVVVAMQSPAIDGIPYAWRDGAWYDFGLMGILANNILTSNSIPTLPSQVGAYPNASGVVASNLAYTASTNAAAARMIATNAQAVADAALPKSGGTIGGNINGSGTSSATNFDFVSYTNASTKLILVDSQTTNVLVLTISTVGFAPKSCIVNTYVSSAPVLSFGLVDSGGVQSCVIQKPDGSSSADSSHVSWLPASGATNFLTWTGWTATGATFQRSVSGTPSSSLSVTHQFLFFR